MNRSVRGKTRLLAGTLILAFSLLVSACSGPANTGQQQAQGTPAPGVTDTEVVIGTFGPLTGPAAAWGDTLRGLAAYAEYINEQGGIHGRQLRVIVEDDQYQPSKTVAAVKKMVEQDKVFALVNVVGTSNLSAVQDYLMQRGVPVVFYSTGSTKFQDPVNPYFFAGLMPYDLEAKILVRYGVETLGVSKFAVFYQNDDFGKDGLKGAREAVAALGAQIVAEVAHSPADVDVSAHVLKMKEAGAEAVLVWGTVKHGALALMEAAKIGFEPKWMMSSVTATFQLPELAEGAAEGVYTVGVNATLDETDHPVVKSYLENHAKYFQTAPNTTQLQGWGAGYAFVEALRRAGPQPTREGLIQALESFQDFQGLSSITFTSDDHIGMRKGWVRQLQNGKFVRISEVIDTSY